MAVGLPVVFQAFINIGVAVNIFPVTGQTLPMVSSGGTAAWMTCVAFGIVLSVSAHDDAPVPETSLPSEYPNNPLDVLSETL